MMDERTFKQLEKIITRLNRQIKKNLELLESEVGDIIQTKEKSQPRIEGILDSLLDIYSFTVVGKKQFRKLNDYYRSFSPENSAEYEKLFNKVPRK